MVVLWTTISCDKLQGQNNYQNPIVRIDIVSLRLDIQTRGAQTFDDLLTWTDEHYIFRSLFTNKPFLDSIDIQLQHLQTTTFDASGESHYIACIILRENGEVDKLGFTRLNITFNGKSFERDDNLLLLIAAHLPESHRNIIYESVRRRKEIQHQKETGTYKETIEDWEKEQEK